MYTTHVPAWCDMYTIYIAVSLCAAVARSPQENDRTELLRQAEPLDYTADNRDMFEGVPQLEGVDYDTSARGYQNQCSAATSRGRSTGPPRNIFDDV